VQADEAFFRQSYSPARSLYQKALQIYSRQINPQSQIQKIDEILSNQASSKPNNNFKIK
jgi:hypothetical protein